MPLLGFWCFRPGICMQKLVNMGVRSLVITSGTLSPMDSFAFELVRHQTALRSGSLGQYNPSRATGARRLRNCKAGTRKMSLSRLRLEKQSREVASHPNLHGKVTHPPVGLFVRCMSAACPRVQGLPFPVRLENTHVIDQSQLWAGCLQKGPAGNRLNSSHGARDTDQYKEELGNCVVNFARVIPDGVLVIFPSYHVMNICIERWQASGNPSIWCEGHRRSAGAQWLRQRDP